MASRGAHKSGTTLTKEKAASFHGPSGMVTVIVLLPVFMQSYFTTSAMGGLSAAGGFALPPLDAGPPSVTLTIGSDDSAVGHSNSCSSGVDICR